MKNYDSLKLKNQLCFPLYLVSKEIIRNYTPELNEINLTYTQYIVMMYMWEHEECNLDSLGKTLMLESSTLTPLLKKLEEKGYVKREKEKKDERNLRITLTKLGEELKDKALKIPEYMGQCINLSEEEAITFYSLLYKVLENIERNGKNGSSRIK